MDKILTYLSLNIADLPELNNYHFSFSVLQCKGDCFESRLIKNLKFPVLSLSRIVSKQSC